MAAIGQAGILGFGPQAGKEVAVGPLASPKWFYHKAMDVDLGVADDQRIFPSEIGGRPTPSGAYKSGVMVGGGFSYRLVQRRCSCENRRILGRSIITESLFA